MKKFISFFAVISVSLLISNTAFTQDWSKEQTAVWSVVQDTWNNWKAKNTAGIATNLHEKYQGWSNEDPLPTGKQELIKWFDEIKDMMKFNYFSIKPARITITKNAAVVDYYYDFSGEFTMNGKTQTKNEKGKSVEFYVYEGGKWLLLGDFMVTIDDNEKDEH